jgi:hypothetical protein
VAGGIRSTQASVELTLERIRTDDDAYYQQPTGVTHFAHDVSLNGGLRGHLSYGAWTISAETQIQHRMNYMFQSANLYAWDSTFDMHNVWLQIGLTFQPSR